VLLWSDPALAIAWPLAYERVLAEEGASGMPLVAAEPYV
jgi:hypothetical protein